MRHLLFLMVLVSPAAAAQIPRNEDGKFEYTRTINVSSTDSRQLGERATGFFSQPFLVHWDTVYKVPDSRHFIMTGKGYLDVRAKLHSVGSPRKVPVWLEFTLEVTEGAYRYTIHDFFVKPKNTAAFEFEKKPDSLRQMVYDQLLQKTHKRISFITGWLKRYMEGEE